MSFGRITMAAAIALSMTSAPVLAAPASALSVAAAQAPAGASLENESELGGGFIIPLLALAAIVAGILIVLDDDEAPESP